MTGHAFQCLLADDDILQAFRAVVAVLAPGRQFVFETRNPACAPWQNWVPARSEIALVTADDVAVRLCGCGINRSRSQAIMSPLINITPLRIARPR